MPIRHHANASPDQFADVEVTMLGADGSNSADRCAMLQEYDATADRFYARDLRASILASPSAGDKMRHAVMT